MVQVNFKERGIAADGYFAFFLLCPAVFLSPPFPTAADRSFSMEIHHTWTSALQQKSNIPGAAWLGLSIVPFHGHPSHWEHLFWESTISL